MKPLPSHRPARLSDVSEPTWSDLGGPVVEAQIAINRAVWIGIHRGLRTGLRHARQQRGMERQRRWQARR